LSSVWEVIPAADWLGERLTSSLEAVVDVPEHKTFNASSKRMKKQISKEDDFDEDDSLLLQSSFVKIKPSNQNSKLRCTKKDYNDDDAVEASDEVAVLSPSKDLADDVGLDCFASGDNGDISEKSIQMKFEVCFVEVKGPNDRLSETQRAWLAILAASGGDARVCKVLDCWPAPSSNHHTEKSLKKSKSR
jgi:hypothetical protein